MSVILPTTPCPSSHSDFSGVPVGSEVAPSTSAGAPGKSCVPDSLQPGGGRVSIRWGLWACYIQCPSSECSRIPGSMARLLLSVTEEEAQGSSDVRKTR